MSDVVRKLNGYPVKVKQFFKELETKAIRVYPDNDHLAEILYNYSKLPEFLVNQKRFETRKLTEKYYNWDNIAKKWESYFDQVKLTGLQGQWKESLNVLQSIKELPKLNSNYDVLTQLASKHLPNHQITSSIILLNLIKDLDNGFAINGMHTEPYTMSRAIDILNSMISNNNLAQNAKNNHENLKNEDFIEYADMKAKLQ
jgi:hypothetical protein